MDKKETTEELLFAGIKLILEGQTIVIARLERLVELAERNDARNNQETEAPRH